MSRREGPSYGALCLRIIAVLWWFSACLEVTSDFLPPIADQAPKSGVWWAEMVFFVWGMGCRIVILAGVGIAASQLPRAIGAGSRAKTPSLLAMGLMLAAVIAIIGTFFVLPFVFHDVLDAGLARKAERAVTNLPFLLVHAGWFFAAVTIGRCSEKLRIHALQGFRSALVVLIVFDTMTGLCDSVFKFEGLMKTLYQAQTSGVDILFGFSTWLTAGQWSKWKASDQ